MQRNLNNTGIRMLSILIPSIPERAGMLKILRDELMRQFYEVGSIHPSLGEATFIECVTESFLNGGMTIGNKRQYLVDKSQSRYLCFLDDDETISPNYVETLLRLCNQGLDVCTFRAMVKMDSCWGLVDMKLAYKVNDQFSPDYDVRRPPWHICPVRSKFAKLHKFKYINNAEDYEWFERVLGHCTTEAHTDKIIFQYNHGKHSEADKIQKQKDDEKI